MLRRNRGISLLELIITVAVVGFIIAISMPSFVMLNANQRIRTATESMRSGLQLARIEALKRGRGVVFNMANLDSTWTVSCEIPVNEDNDGDGLPDCPSQIQLSDNTASGAPLTITTDGSALVTFTGLGLVRQVNQDGSVPFTRVDITVPDTGNARTPLRILLPAGGLSRICDPAISTVGDTRKC